MAQLPSNLVAYVIGAPVFLVFGYRGWRNYLRLHNPLSRYFALSGLLAAAAFGLWSIPFIFTTDHTVLIAVSILGDGFLYAMLFLQARLVHYLVLTNKVNKWLLLAPLAVLALVGWASHIYGYINYGISVSPEEFTYELPFLADIIQVFLLSIVIWVGLLLLRRVKNLPSARSKVALLGVALLYLLSGLGGALNVISSGAPNESPAIIGSYIFGFALFMSVFIITRLLGSKSLNSGSRSE
jgi:hypothetical protein